MIKNEPLEQLLPCPFCGSHEIATTWARMTDELQFYGVCCGTCMAEIDSKSSALEAIAAWNTRVQARPDARDVERIIAKLRALSEKQRSQRGDYLYKGRADPEIDEAADYLAALNPSPVQEEENG